MLSSVLSKTRHLKRYLLIWLSIAAIHFLVFYTVYKIDLSLAIADALVFNLFFAGLGSGIWYLVLYNNPEQKRYIDLIISHLGGMVTTVAIMLGVSFLMIKLFMPDPDRGQAIMEELMYGRIFHISFFYILIVSFYYLYSYAENLHAKELDQANLNTMMKEAELNMLKLQIKPHFLFNSLNSIAALTRKDPQSARNMILELSDFIRYTLKNKMNGKTTVKNEIENLRHYINIERIRFGDILKYEEEIDPACWEKHLPHLILQPLAENAIKYGIYESTETVLIHLKCIDKDGFFSIELSNNYDGQNNNLKGEGIGLKNIKERMRLVYGKTNLVFISDEGGMFTVRLIFPDTT